MRSMKRRNHSKPKPTAPPADLLVCFPARAHLTLLPSPARAPAEPHRRHHRKAQPSYSQASPLPWAKEMSSEPTSPKVTCAGQIKIRPHAHRSTKNWQSVMEEIERIHNKKKLNQNSLGFKGEIVNFLSCLRGFRFDFRCFRGFPQSDITTEDEEEEEEAEPESESESEQEPIEDSSKRGRTMFSEWFMVLQEEETKPKNNDVVSSLEFQPSSVSVPPPNALLLMRCRSAPNSLLRKPKQEEEEEEEEAEKQSKISLKLLMEEEKEVVVAKKKSLMVMDYDADFYKLSSDIAKETWVVSGSSNSKCNDDPLLRSRSWKK
ncbi:unnamed protein product [Citrullus colocynthis]|uniref:Uncharacterized protein n=1 Tax=Citrullus colocynthis TaxID=252529 RepID=A0ABP0XY51_9ROSI